mgnify:CR=1 FL=1
MNKIYLLLLKRGRNAYHAIHPWMVTNEQGQMRNFFFDRKKLVIAISSEAVSEDVFLWNEFRQKTKLSFIKIIWVATYRSYIMSAFRAKFYLAASVYFCFFTKIQRTLVTLVCDFISQKLVFDEKIIFFSKKSLKCLTLPLFWGGFRHFIFCDYFVKYMILKFNLLSFWGGFFAHER